MARAIESSEEYDEQSASLLAAGRSTLEAYWELVASDVSTACAVTRPVHDDSHGMDGFVSVEVAPDLAGDTERTILAARRLHQRVDEPNLMVNIPATAQGVPAIEALPAEGRNINVTLTFSLSRYAEVIEAYLAGLESLVTNGGDAARVHSHAGSRWERLAGLGAHPQRPLWASTSPKDPGLRDTYYDKELIGPHAITTLAARTIDQFEDHGAVSRTVDTGVAEASDVRRHLDDLGIDLEDVGLTLEQQGVEGFLRSYQGVLELLGGKRHHLGWT